MSLKNPVPGEFSHASIECEHHGPQAIGFKPKGSTEKMRCRDCVLEGKLIAGHAEPGDFQLAQALSGLPIMMPRTRVSVESPLGADTEEELAANKAYALRCVMDCFARGEAPFASHVFYDRDGLLTDADPSHRTMGIESGFAWTDVAEVVAVYMDRGVSDGMRQRIERSQLMGQRIELRWLDERKPRVRSLQIKKDEVAVVSALTMTVEASSGENNPG